ncbi:gamma-aminobutyraldehyde dehydrogenase [Pseudomonas sp. ATCC 13867]|nr:gamma-aminobutyraldehyde dehydrogenase [Pseudomonas sp. ATCC 13867]
MFRFFAGACRVMQGSATGEYLPAHTSMIRHDPVGVVASIAPWNYPLMMVVWKLGQARTFSEKRPPDLDPVALRHLFAKTPLRSR